MPDKAINKKHIISSMVFPPILEFAKIIFGINVFIDQHEHYEKRSSRNRYSILSPNGVQCLTIPLKKGKNNNKSMRDVLISYDTSWMKKHLRAIKTAYGSAPFYPYYIDEISELFNLKHTTLIAFNISIINCIAALLNLSIDLKLTDKYYDNASIGMIFTRKVFHGLKNNGPINSPTISNYEQVFSDRFDFVPNLSILDLLFCLGPESGQYLKEIYHQLDCDEIIN